MSVYSVIALCLVFCSAGMSLVIVLHRLSANKGKNNASRSYDQRQDTDNGIYLDVLVLALDAFFVCYIFAPYF